MLARLVINASWRHERNVSNAHEQTDDKQKPLLLTDILCVHQQLGYTECVRG